MPAPLPANEIARLLALRSCGLLDTAPEVDFDDLAQLAAQIFHVPFSAVSFVDADRQWFKARVGLPTCQTSRDDAFCAHAILDPTQPLVVPDATLDPRFADSALVTGEPYIRFYAGAPMVTRDGLALGSLCVKDIIPRQPTPGQVDALVRLARQAMRLVEARQYVVQLAEQRTAVDHHALVAIASPTGCLTYVNDRFCALTQYDRPALLAARPGPCSGADPGGGFFAAAWPTIAQGDIWCGEVAGTARDGSAYWAQATVMPLRDPGGTISQFIAIATDITPQKLAETEQQQQKSELRVLFDYIPAMICFKDTKNRILRTNARMAEYLGKTVSEIEGHSAHQFFPDVAEKFYEDDLEVIRSGAPKLGIIESFAGRNGEKIWIQTDKVPVRDAHGRVTGLVAMAQDITARKQAQEALQQRQTELQVLFDLMPAMIWFKDTQNNFLRGNRTAAESAGRQPADFEGRPCRDIYPDEADRYFADDLEVIRAGRPKLGIIEPIEGRDGIKLWIRTDKVPYRDSAGNIVGIVVMAQDITERKVAEERLRLLSSALEQCKDSVVITDARLRKPGPRIQFVNPAFTAMSGYTSDEAVGRTLEIQQGPLSNADAMRRLVRTLARGRPSHDEVVSYRKDGTTFELEWHVAPIRNAAGEVTHFVGIQRDVTARNAAAAELVRAREAALESVRLKSRFLANMSHELRTPLNTINGVSAVLLEQELTPTLRQSVGLIHHCGEVLLQNIQTILTHSSLDSAKLTMAADAFVPSEVVLNALRITANKAREKGLALDYYLDPAMPTAVVGDAFRLQQVLVNLLANAIKFTDCGCVALRVRSRALRAGRYELGFTVADSGVGITPAGLARLFLPFSQVDNSSTRRFEGTGLGLAISKSLIELMGGKITVRSKPGRGSIFHFSVVIPAAPGAVPLAAATRRPVLAGRRVLIVEPNSLRRRQLVGLARAWSMIPTVALGTGTAIAATLQNSYDFVIRRAPPPDGSPPPADLPFPVAWLCAEGIQPPAGRLPSVRLADPCAANELASALAILLADRPAAAAVPASGRLADRLPLRILSADDISTNREMLKFMCRHLGYETDLVTNGMEVLQRLESHAYDLILLDVNMPELDGLSAAREICRRQPDPARRPKLVAITANVLAGDRERCLAAGMDAYLSKPLVPPALAGCIEKLFAAGPAASALPLPPTATDLPWIDVDHLRQVVDGLDGPEARTFLNGLQESGGKDCRALLPLLRAAAAGRRAEELQNLVHGLKGCVLSMGWKRMGLRCADALAALRGNRFKEWDTLAPELQALCDGSIAEWQSLAPQFEAHAPADKAAAVL